MRSLAAKWNDVKNNPAFQLAPWATLFRLLEWRIICSLDLSGTVITLPRWDVKIWLPARWNGVPKFIFVYRENYEFEMKYLENQMQPGNVMVDVGANLGIYSMIAGKLVGDHGKVLAFEPSFTTFEFLKKNQILNGLKNISCFPVALSDTAGTATLYHSSDIGSHSLGQIDGMGNLEEIEMTTMDKVVATEGLERIDLIKIDVEGAEELVLKGAEMSIKRWRPTVIFERHINLPERLGLPADGAWNFLADLGYHFYRVNSQGRLQALSSPLIGNIIALHHRV